jgi:A/G-specific adenine glycosylase
MLAGQARRASPAAIVDVLKDVCYRGRTDMTRAQRLKRFQRRLIAWYKVNQRKLPWRETRDPYRILVSEVMLQQTQVDRVMPKYHEFLERYPTLAALAKAKTRELRKTWYPLGYNIRPMRLRQIARQTISQHGGRLPDTHDGLIAMEGIGRYTAGAVLSFAYEQDAPILDTNVARLLSRYFRVRGPVKGGATERKLWALAKDVIPTGQGYTMNQAMMDFGALICNARAPKCGTCALRRGCRSYPHELAHAKASFAPARSVRAGRD